MPPRISLLDSDDDSDYAATDVTGSDSDSDQPAITGPRVYGHEVYTTGCGCPYCTNYPAALRQRWDEIRREGTALAALKRPDAPRKTPQPSYLQKV